VLEGPVAEALRLPHMATIWVFITCLLWGPNVGKTDSIPAFPEFTVQ
jgi:hypothetical protein